MTIFEQPQDGNQAPYDASDPEQVAAATKAAKVREQMAKQFAQSFLDTKEKRAWMWGMLNDLHVFEQRIPMTDSQYTIGFFNGEREAGLRLQRIWSRSSPTNFAKMIAENDK